MSRSTVRDLRVLAALLACGLALSARPALAHKLMVFATAEGAEIQGYAYFPGGGRAANLPVTVLGPEGQQLGETRTDAEGRFVFHAQTRCDHRLVVDTGAGHRATHTVTAEELPGELPGPQSTARPGEPGEDAGKEESPVSEPSTGRTELQRVVERAVSRQIRPLREDLEAHHSRARLHEIIGGIGYIVGIMGLLFFLRGRFHRDEEC